MENNLEKCLELHTYLYPPYSYYVRGKDGEMVTVGIMTDVIKLLMDHFGFCYSLTPWASSGTHLPNGSWTELLKHFADGTADIGASLLALDSERTEIMDYQVMGLHAFSFLYKAPRVEPDFAGFVKPYTYYGWAAVFISIVGMMIALWLISKGISFVGTKSKVKSKSRSMVGSIDICLRVLFAQDLPDPDKTIDRVIVGTWLLMSFILGAIYKGNLMAMLITPKVIRPFDSLDQLVESNVPFYLLKNNIVETQTKAADPNTAMGKAAIRAVGFKSVTNMMVTMGEIARGDYALSVMPDAARFVVHNYFQMTGRCAFMIAHETFLSTPVAILLKRGSPRNRRLKKALVGLLEFGIFGKMVDEALKNVKTCEIIEQDQKSETRALQLEDFAGVFLLFAGGIALSIVVFTAEIIIGRRKKDLPSENSES